MPADIPTWVRYPTALAILYGGTACGIFNPTPDTPTPAPTRSIATQTVELPPNPIIAVATDPGIISWRKGMANNSLYNPINLSYWGEDLVQFQVTDAAKPYLYLRTYPDIRGAIRDLIYPGQSIPSNLTIDLWFDGILQVRWLLNNPKIASQGGLQILTEASYAAARFGIDYALPEPGQPSEPQSVWELQASGQVVKAR